MPGCKATKGRTTGHVVTTFPDDWSPPFVTNMQTMRSVEHVFAFVCTLPDVKGPSESMPAQYRQMPYHIDAAHWEKALTVWRAYKTHVDHIDEALLSKPVFRATALTHSRRENRNDVALAFAESFEARFSWEADILEYQLEIVLRRRDDDVDVLIALSEESVSCKPLKSKRVLSSAALRPSVAYAMAWLMQPQLGDVWVEAMCGCGTITEVAASEFPGASVRFFCLPVLQLLFADN
jgi:hypothetical protein